MNNKEVTPVQIAIRIMIIIVVIVILLLISFGIVRIVPSIFSGLSNLRTNFFAGKEKMILSLDKTSVAPGESAILSYRQSGGKAEGFYALTYSCQSIHSSTQLEVIGETDTGTAFCGEPFIIGNAGSSTKSQTLTIRPFSDSISYDQDIKIEIAHMKDVSSLASSSVTLTLEGEDSSTDRNEEDTENTSGNNDSKEEAADEEDETPARTSEPTPRSTTPASPADLTVAFSQISVNGNDRGTIVFYVTNRGGTASGSWRFTAALPRDGGTQIYESSFQPSIPARGTSILTLSFDNAASGIASIAIDPRHQVRESNENNNYAEIRVR